jgi:hypothetical protein
MTSPPPASSAKAKHDAYFAEKAGELIGPIRTAIENDDRVGLQAMVEDPHFMCMAITPGLLRKAAHMNREGLLDVLVTLAHIGVLRVAIEQTLKHSVDALKLLLARSNPEDHLSLLHHAAQHSTLDRVQAIAPYCDIGAKDSGAMMAAANQGAWDIVRFLLPHSELTDQKGTILFRMVDKEAPADLLDQALAEITNVETLEVAFRLAARQEKLDVLEKLMNHPDLAGRCDTAFETALINGRRAATDLLAPHVNFTAVKNKLVARIHEKPGGPTDWNTVDDLGVQVDTKTQDQWVKQHPGKLPKTERLSLAHQRQSRAQNALSASPLGRPRHRP